MSDTQRIKRSPTKQPRGQKDISVLSWMGTLFLSSIPVINLIFFILWAITAKKTTRKRFARACLILLAIFAVAIALSIIFLAPQLTDLLTWLRDLVASWN